MRLKEWFSWHFPELTKIVNDNVIFTKLVHLVEKRENITDEMKERITDIVLDDEKAQQILDASKISMGQEMSETDCLQIKRFSERCVELVTFRDSLSEYLKQRMNAVAPNLAALIGDIVGSKLISHAGGLTNLSKYPASTIQILGAEKALFRALKTKGKTPKYGLIFNSTFIGRAQQKNKGRISRYLANKCAIASRVDCYSEAPTNKFGESLKDQMEERLKYLAAGTKPRKNKEVMDEVIQQLKDEGLYFGENKKAGKAGEAEAKQEKRKEKKRKHSGVEADDSEVTEKPKKKKKASK
jgi:nucleolar protein 56